MAVGADTARPHRHYQRHPLRRIHRRQRPLKRVNCECCRPHPIGAESPDIRGGTADAAAADHHRQSYNRRHQTLQREAGVESLEPEQYGLIQPIARFAAENEREQRIAVGAIVRATDPATEPVQGLSARGRWPVEAVRHSI